MHRLRVRHACRPKGRRGRELVVGRGQGCAAVQHLHAARIEPVEGPEPGLDPVERRQDVETSERNVPTAKPRQRLGRAEHDPEADIRRRDPMGDHGERAHSGKWSIIRRLRGRAGSRSDSERSRDRYPLRFVPHVGLAAGTRAHAPRKAGPLRVTWGNDTDRPGKGFIGGRLPGPSAVDGSNDCSTILRCGRRSNGS